MWTSPPEQQSEHGVTERLLTDFRLATPGPAHIFFVDDTGVIVGPATSYEILALRNLALIDKGTFMIAAGEVEWHRFADLREFRDWVKHVSFTDVVPSDESVLEQNEAVEGVEAHLKTADALKADFSSGAFGGWVPPPLPGVSPENPIHLGKFPPDTWRLKRRNEVNVEALMLKIRDLRERTVSDRTESESRVTETLIANFLEAAARMDYRPSRTQIND